MKNENLHWQLQRAREEEVAADHLIHSAQDLNHQVATLQEADLAHRTFPVSGDAIQRARYYQQQG